MCLPSPRPAFIFRARYWCRLVLDHALLCYLVLYGLVQLICMLLLFGLLQSILAMVLVLCAWKYSTTCSSWIG